MMALLGSYKNWSIPVQETEWLELDTVNVAISDEDALLDIIDAISTAQKIEPPILDALKEDEVAEATARRNLCGLVGKKNVDHLDLVLTYYATRKTYFSALVRLGDKNARQLDKLGRHAEALQEGLTLLDKQQLLPLTGLSPEQSDQFKQLLGAFQPKNGVREKSLPDLEGALAEALIEWWHDVLKLDTKFWWIPDPGSGEASASHFLRFVSAVLSALPPDLRPTETKGSPGFGRNALRRRHKQLTKGKRDYEHLIAWLGTRSTEPIRRD